MKFEDDLTIFFCCLQARLLSAHNRFYTALALHDLVNEVPLMVVSAKYGASKGMLQVKITLKETLVRTINIIIIIYSTYINKSLTNCINNIPDCLLKRLKIYFEKRLEGT